MFFGKTLLITGGTGSFGNAVLRRFLKTDIKEVRIFSRDEKKQEDMRIKLNNSKVNFFIGNVRDYDSILPVMEGVDYVFHAAALKQVPSCEFHPLEAIRTNSLGTENALNAALAKNVEKLIALSTDKAVYPINAMGMSKAMMEKLVIAKSRLTKPEKTILCCTRYGNVMATRGSVIPLFVKQVMKKKPITITDPNMTRFLLSLEDSVDLVLYAYDHARQGDIFVRKSPACTINDLAQAIIELFEADTEIKIIGTRHGEKLYETLLTREEMAHVEDLGDYYRVPVDERDLNYNKFFIEGKQEVSQAEDYNSHNTQRLNVKQVKEKLLKLGYIKKALSEWRDTA